MKKMIERQLAHHELMDWVESAETAEEMQERADHANAGYPVFVKEEADEIQLIVPEQLSMPAYDYETSIVIADKVLALPKHCWSNSVRALRTCKQQLRGAFYVEGHIEFIPGLYIQHGWLELPDGTIVDPTRAFLECYHGHTPDNRTYYPLLTYILADLRGVRSTDLPLGMIELNVGSLRDYQKRYSKTYCVGKHLKHT